MGKENFDAYSVGRFEASNFTRNALMGNREGNNIRSQQLGTPKDAFKQVETFTPKQLKAKEAITGLQHGQEYKNVKDAQELQDSINFINLSNRKAFQEDMLMRMEPQIWAAIDRRLGEEGKKQVLAAAKAREASVEKTVGADQEQAIVVKQVEAETAKILAQAPETLLYGGSLAVLAVWVINRLPSRFFKAATVMTIMSLILGGCMAVNAATNTPETPNPNNPTSTEVANLPDETEEAQPTITATRPAPTATVTVTPTETAQPSPVDGLLASYLAGEVVDVSVLSEEELAEFSSELAEKMNAERGINPVIYNGEAYISPGNYMMMNYDGHPDRNETITMYHAIEGFDEEGNLQINVNGEVITIENSANMDWRQRVTDPRDPNFNWPNTEKYAKAGGLTEAQGRVAKGFELFPAILLDKDPGIIYLEGFGERSTYRFLTVITDSSGKPILTREILVFGGPDMYLQEEGSASTYVSGIGIQEQYLDFYKKLSENTVYYLGGLADQKFMYEALGFNLDGYSGIIDSSDTYPTIDGTATNNGDMLVLANSLLIKRAKQ